MQEKTLRERCSVNTNIDTDVFVGIKAVHGDIKVNFPLGYHISDDEKGLRRDIMLLLNTLAKNSEKKESELNSEAAYHDVKLPIQAYMHVISDYYLRGIYREREIVYTVEKQGKVDWKKTVKTQRAYIQDGEAFYLDYVTKKKSINDNELITLIHQYCVYESFSKVGWIFSGYMPPKPMLDVSLRRKYYASVVRKKLTETFNDRNRQLFKNMLLIIDCIGNDGEADTFKYGTYRFEYVWESMIDKAYGIREKDYYFPKTRWNIGGKDYDNAALEPDTIMLLNGKVYVLDAKYYKFGWSGKPEHLPKSTSINKQVTYGEYIAETDKFKDSNGNHPIVYNAFIMPYDSCGNTFHTKKDLHYIGSAFSDWKAAGIKKSYEEVAGILLDVKSLMRNHSSSADKVVELSRIIEESVDKNAE